MPGVPGAGPINYSCGSVQRLPDYVTSERRQRLVVFAQVAGGVSLEFMSDSVV